MKRNRLIAGLVLIICAFAGGCVTMPRESSAVELILNDKRDEARERFQSKYDINETDKDGNSALHAAALVNDADLTAFLLYKGADARLKNNGGDTPLHLAIKNGSADAAQALVETDAAGAAIFDKNANGVSALDAGLKTGALYYDIFITEKTGALRDEEGNTIVHYFVASKDKRAVDECIAQNIPLSVTNDAGKTPLDIALTDADDINAVEIAAALILAGAEQAGENIPYFHCAVAERNLSRRFDDGQTALHIASGEGQTGIVQYLLENGADTKAQDITGSTPLHVAVRYGYADIVQQLLASGTNVNAEDNLGKTPVMLVMPTETQVEIYQLLISYRADVSHKDAYGDTALHSAAMIDMPTGILQMLVSAGADINTRNKEGVAPFAIAVQKGNLAQIRFFAERGADVHSADKNGATPLTLALDKGQSPLEAAVNRTNALSRDSGGNMPLHIALARSASSQQVQYILSLMDNVNARNGAGNNALYLAVERGDKTAGELLLAKNADIFATNNENDSPLHLALRQGREAQDWLITSRTITATDGSGNTALHYAAEWRLPNAVVALLEKGANPQAENANGETPLFSAVKANDAEMIALMVRHGSSIHARDNLGNTLLHTAVRWDADDSIRELALLGIDVDAQNAAGKSALVEAVVANKFDAAQLLIICGADVNASNSAGRSVLMDAINQQNINIDIIALLLASGANPQMQEINGRNAYHEAALTENEMVIALIRNAGGNPLSRDKNGDTPFSLSFGKSERIVNSVLGDDKTVTDSDGNTPAHIIVQSKGPERILSLLARRGFPMDTRNSDGVTPLSCAVENNERNYALILLQNGANPFSSIDKRGRNAATIALEKNDANILADIVKYAGAKADMQGNTILHYAARMSTPDTIRNLLSYGLDASVKNIAGEMPYETALRWKRNDAAVALMPNVAGK